MGLPRVVTPPIPVPELLDGFATLDSCAVSDALDVLGLPAGLGVIRRMWGGPFVVGFAVTVQVEPYEPGPAGPHIATSAVANAGPDDVIVMANDGRTDVSCWGGLLSLGAQLRGVRAAVVDGGMP
jgi:regulator of RNase E activity RraA